MIAAGPFTYFHDFNVAALARAGADGDVALVRELVANGASPNARGDHKLTPFLWTLGHANVAGVEAMLAAGADPTLADEDGNTGLGLAAAASNPELLKAMLETGRVDVNAWVEGNQTMLMLAANYGLLQQARLLLQAGANPNVTDEVGGTALTYSTGHYDVSLALLEAGADPHHKAGRTSFAQDVAAEADNVDVMPPEYRAAYEKVVAWLKDHHDIVPPPPPIPAH